MMIPGQVPECFLTDLFEVIEAVIDEKIACDHGRDSSTEMFRASALKQELIDVWSFGEKP